MQPCSAKYCKHTAPCEIRILYLALANSVFYPFRFGRQTLGVIKPFHLITHSPSCKHFTSPLSFQHPVFQHQLTRIPGSPRTVTRLPPPFHPDWNLFCCTLLISSILYVTHPHHSISSSVFQPLEQCCKLVWPLIIIYLNRNLLFPLPHPLYKLPFPLFCNKNSKTQPICFTCTSIKNHQ